MPNPFFLAAPFVLGATVIGFLFYMSNIEYFQSESNHYRSSDYAYRSRSNDDAQWSRSNDNASQRRDKGSFRNIKRKKKEDDCEDVCVICMELLDNRKVKALRCHHQFHSVCVTKWLEEQKLCPLCRYPS